MKIPLRGKWQPHSSILAWEIPCIEETGGLRSTRLQKSQPQFSNEDNNMVVYDWGIPSPLSVVVQLLSRVWFLWPHGLQTLGFPVLHCLLKLAQTHVHWVDDAIQPSHLLSLPSSPALNLSQHQGLFQWVGSWHQVTKVLELQHQSFQWIFRVDFF